MTFKISVVLLFITGIKAFPITPDSLSSIEFSNSLLMEDAQQQKQVSGKITDGSGEPMPGVNVSVKGSTIGNMSDVSGNFSLGVPGNVNTLVFSFIGMKTQEINIDNRTVINIVMEMDLIGMKKVEVVAVGYSSS